MYDLYLTIMWLAGALFSFGITSIYYILKLHRIKQEYEQEHKLAQGLQRLYYDKMDIK